jgi:hypothetical protein
MSAREQDKVNGWVIIKDNPISKVGVFEYAGRQISPKLEPDKIYKVYRPAEELGNPETIESFKMIPWTNDHPRTLFNMQMDGEARTDDKIIHGAVGENVYFDGEYLRANIKIFSKQLADEIENGKKELSIGYKCIPDLTPGVYNGERYDVVQRNIRGNHLALVDEGRSGPDVSVLDQYMMTYDTKELNQMGENENKKAEDAKTCDAGELSLEILNEKIMALTEAVNKLVKPEAANDEPVAPAAEAKAEDAEEPKVAEAAAMDAKLKTVQEELHTLKSQGIKALLNEVSQRDQLYKKLSAHVGVFDHADKTLAEVAEYGIKKLGLTVEKGHELTALNSYFAGRDVNSHARAANTMDSKATKTAGTIATFIKEGAQ